MLGPGPKRRRLGAWSGGYIIVSVIVSAAHVIAALFAVELALALRQPRRADRTPDHRLLVLLARGQRLGFAHRSSIISETGRFARFVRRKLLIPRSRKFRTGRARPVHLAARWLRATPALR